MAVKVKILNAEQIQQRLREMSDKMAAQALEDAVKAGIEACLDAEQKKTPTKTGKLKGAYEIKTIEKSRGRVRMGLFMRQEAFYWRFLEFGTKRGIVATAHQWIRKVFKSRRGFFRNVVRDTFRDRIQGFLD